MSSLVLRKLGFSDLNGLQTTNVNLEEDKVTTGNIHVYGIISLQWKTESLSCLHFTPNEMFGKEYTGILEQINLYKTFPIYKRMRG